MQEDGSNPPETDFGGDAFGSEQQREPAVDHEPSRGRAGVDRVRNGAPSEVRPEERVSTGQVSEDTQPSYIVGVGASAGGLAPLEEFFAATPNDTRAAFVVVQHLSPDFKSLMKEILSRVTSLEVLRAQDGDRCRPGRIYLIPPRRYLEIEGGVLRVREARIEDDTPPHPIDVFLKSLAIDQGSRAVAVILSGSGSDGCRGVHDIAQAGGMVLCQSPETAQFDGMPRASIGTGVVEQVLEPAELAKTVARVTSDLEDEVVGASDDAASDSDLLQRIAEILQREDGIDFSHYRGSTVRRRVQLRAKLLGHLSLETYIEVLSGSRQERQSLRNALLISVTSFFRDPYVWEHLERDVLPDLVENASRRGLLRVWNVACATGEEAYSTAILLSEYIDRAGVDLQVKMFATDIDSRALQRAVRGVYAPEVVESLGEERLERFFNYSDGEYRVNRRLREMLIFAEHNVARDAPFTRMDLIICRNMLIYMQSSLQEQVLAVLNFSLRPHGCLMLGTAETIGVMTEAFAPIDGRCKTFRKVAEASPRLEERRFRGVLRPTDFNQGNKSSGERPYVVRQKLEDASLARCLRNMVGDFGLTCLIVDRYGRLRHVIGDGSKYLQVREGAVTDDLTRLAHPSLATPISTALHQARMTKGPVRYSAIDLEGSDDGPVELTVRAIPAEQSGETDLFSVLIRFALSDPDAVASQVPPVSVDKHAESRIQDLERELQTTRENLQSTIEELESTNEEQQSTNEELIASNEELQSTNEELQSLNEELYTVNAELQSKNFELLNLNVDFDHFLQTLHIGTVFLDRDLVVRRFTPSARLAFRMDDRDIGRPLTDLSHRTDCVDLPRLLDSVRMDGQQIERLVRTEDDALLMLRIFPTERSGDLPSGIVLTLVGIDLFDLHDSSRTTLRDAIVSATPTLLRSWGDETLNVLELRTGKDPASPQQVSRDDYLDHVHEDDRKRVRERLDALHRGEGPIREVFRRRDGNAVLLLGARAEHGAESSWIELPLPG